MIAPSTARRFLFVMFEGGGNVPPQLGLARRLALRGHRVRVLADPAIARDVTAAGCEFAAFRHAPHQHMRDRQGDRLRDWEVKNPFELLRRLREELFFGPADRYARDVLEEAERFDPAAIAADCMLFGAIAGAERTGRPTAVLMHTAYQLPTDGATPFGFGLMPARNGLERLRDRLMRGVVTQGFDKGLPRLNEVRRGLGLAPLRGVNEQLLAADRVFVLTSPAFDFVPPRLPANVAYVGPQLDDPAWTDAWRAPWAEPPAEPVVLVSMGSTFQNQRDVTARVIEALAGLPVRAIVTTGGQFTPDELPVAPNVTVLPSAPHHAILPQARLVVCHGGHGTVIKALASGTPVLCLPLGRDQLDNAARVAASGAGLRLKPTATGRELAEAMRRLLDEPAFSAAARRLADAIAREAAADGGIEALEELAARPVLVA